MLVRTGQWTFVAVTELRTSFTCFVHVRMQENVVFSRGGGLNSMSAFLFYICSIQDRLRELALTPDLLSSTVFEFSSLRCFLADGSVR